MDNLQAHRWQPTVNAIEQAGHNLIFCPLYSPEFGPVELVIGQLKGVLRQHTRDIDEQNMEQWIAAGVRSGSQQQQSPWARLTYGFWKRSGL